MRASNHTIALVALAAAAVLPAGLASASDNGQPAARTNSREIMVCGTDAATRRAFTREHGAAPIFVTAREALSVRVSDPAWTTPRCMTAREHTRYRDAATTFAAVR
ncbi:MAG: hypothetical protein FD125_1064 [bacterium]|nr:MAG: hypothetical protein FD125_1064 [bacterium]